ncbi:dienelactone hydrolase family protein [Stutzerimonas xanthomarina]|uniref:Dienelactone hydrolase n=2 Tax=Stutzerimonas xanthomarina TaxID=271420 RepID=A0A1M5P1L6_9GAMM|nr:dienelactone hydrolase family protein [Stutzerimonas xanthomarina]MCP9338636.1 dienelactone hydrolase family protein [Stutzerimonas xanthomarina]SEH78754.1 Dienelactone hydrolase [Stutzerimonas xanthomarina]SHG95706.1 Dienelactone hydrolase [Stutzerimonas xanthomarina DSM 18231]
MRYHLFGAALMAVSAFAHAEIQTQEIPYTAADGTKMVGYYAYDDAIEGQRPGVVVVHEWWGLNDYAKSRARDLAGLGYSALAIDMYGEGKNTEHPKDAMSFMKAALADADAAKARFNAGVDLLKQQQQTDSAKLAAVGYCFGGKVVLDMARQGVPLEGVVSFHGALATETRAAPGSVKARVLVEHGSADSMVSAEDVAALSAEMVKAGADYQFVNLPGAKHGFTNPGADKFQKKGVDVAYNKAADERSWNDMQRFLDETFEGNGR